MSECKMPLADTALILGGGIAGLAAAGVAARYFREVILVERDNFPAEPAVRKGVPQGAQIHNLLAYGLNSFDAIFPGFRERLAEDAILADYGKDLRGFTNGKWQPQRDFGLTSYFQSRPLLEHKIRQSLAACPNVVIREGLSVEGLVFSGSGSVTGAICESKSGTTETLLADLTLDCTGRGSHSPDQLEKAGYGRVETQRIGIQLMYATAFFRKRPEQYDQTQGCLIANQFPDTRFGVLLPIEDNCLLCTLGGQFGNYPPRDMEGFLNFARELVQPDIYEIVHDLEVVQPVTAYRLPQTFWHRYDKLEEFPQGFLPVGDAVAGFNPALGQGMTVAARYVMTIDELLAERAEAGTGLDGLARDYLPKMAAAAGQAWESGLAVNFAHPEATGDRPENLLERLLLLKGISLLSAKDPEVHRLSLYVRHMLETPEKLQTADIVARARALVS